MLNIAGALPVLIAPAIAPVILAIGGGSYGVLYAVAGVCAIIGARRHPAREARPMNSTHTDGQLRRATARRPLENDTIAPQAARLTTRCSRSSIGQGHLVAAVAMGVRTGRRRARRSRSAPGW